MTQNVHPRTNTHCIKMLLFSNGLVNECITSMHILVFHIMWRSVKKQGSSHWQWNSQSGPLPLTTFLFFCLHVLSAHCSQAMDSCPVLLTCRHLHTCFHSHQPCMLRPFLTFSSFSNQPLVYTGQVSLYSGLFIVCLESNPCFSLLYSLACSGLGYILEFQFASSSHTFLLYFLFQ